MKAKVLRGEIYSRLGTIKKHYERLCKYKYPTKGAERLRDLTIKIIDVILERFNIYTDTQVSHIATLNCEFEGICGYLSESRISNVPWSIIPTIEKVFESIHSNNEFVISPLWKSNYQINIGDVITYYKTVLGSGNLFFDAVDKADLNKKISDFLADFTGGIYFMFYPKLERLSAVHFAILGHEIGHIFAEEWMNASYIKFRKKYDFDNEIGKIAKKERIAKGIAVSESVYVGVVKARYSKIFSRGMKELLSDIYGASIFGDTFIVAEYLFFQRGSIDDVESWEQGYPTDRFRLKNAFDAIAFIKKQNKFPADIKCGWEELILECTKEPSFDGKKDEYIDFFIKKFELEKEELFKAVMAQLKSNIFTAHVRKDLIDKAVERLLEGIPPNAFLNESGEERPIDFRNILYATTLCHYEKITKELQEYEQQSKIINLLSVKGIELSMEHERFMDNDTCKS